MTIPVGSELLGVLMLFVAFILLVVALNLQGKVGATETGILCILVGGLCTISGFYNGFVVGDAGSMAGNLLFGFTYLFFAMNLLMKSDTGTGLGFFCLGVLATAIVFTAVSAASGAYLMAFYWFLWGQLWGCFWVANGLQKDIKSFLIKDTYFVVVLNFAGAIGFLFGWLTL